METKKTWLAWVVLVTGMVVTTIACCYVKTTTEAAAEREFSFAYREIQEKIDNRLANQASLLRSSAALFDITGTVTRDTWRSFSRRMNFDVNPAGINALGFSLLIPKGQLARHTRQVRTDGFPHYRVWPSGEREIYSSIIYLEPFSAPHLQAFGFDMLSEPVRRAAMEVARDQKATTLSGKVALIREPGAPPRAGTIMYYPVYRPGQPTETVSQRRSALLGWVYTPCRGSDLMQGTLGGWDLLRDKRIRLQVFDGDQLTDRFLLYDSQAGETAGRSCGPEFTRLARVNLPGSHWTLRFSQPKELLMSLGCGSFWLTLAGGLTVSLLLFAQILSLLTTRARARQIARDLTVELQDRETFTRDVLNSMAASVAVLGPDNTIIEVNEPWRRFARENSNSLDEPEHIGMPYFSATRLHTGSDDDRLAREAVAGIQAVQDGNLREFTLEYPCHSPNERRWFLMRVTPLTGSRKGVVVAHTVITPRVLAQESRRQSEEQFRLLFENSGDAIFITYPNGSVVAANPEACRVFGMSEQELIDSGRQGLVDRNDTRLPEALAIRERTGRFKGELNFIRGDGTVFNADVTASTFLDSAGNARSAVQLRDVTERRLAEDALRASEERFRTFVEHASDLIFSLDSRGVFTYLSPNWSEILGHAPAEPVGQPLEGFVHPDDRQALTDYLAAIRENGRSHPSFEYRVRHQDGGWRYLSSNFSLVTDEVSREFSYVGIARDYSERKRYEEELAAARDAAEAANRAKSEFLANMSHEIRTPMNGIMGMAQLLEFTNPTAEQQEYLNDIKTSSDSLLSLINDILDLSKIEAGKLDLERMEFSLRVSIGDVLKTQSSLLHGKGLTLEISIGVDVPDLLLGDQLRLKQILLNILGNAIKFTEKGSIRLSARVTDCQDRIALVEIVVADSGIGIAPESLKGIFAPFSQADASTTRTYGGTGLGLSICTRLTELMGGRIWAESTPGVGSAFHVRIPFVVNEPVRIAGCPAVRDRPALDGDGAPLRILVAEDQETNLKFSMQILERRGHTVVSARNGQEALDTWAKGAFDFILMDIQMPVMNGIEATRAIRRREKGAGCHVPIIALTALALHGDREKLLGEGFDGYIAKPIDIDSLFGEMHRCLVPDLSFPAGSETVPDREAPGKSVKNSSADQNRA